MVTIVSNAVLYVWMLLRINLKRSHHNNKKPVTMCWWMLTRLIVVIVLQYTQMLNHYVVHLKLI